jgi:SDR family mycofactocin-dependent oxidoreductase
MGRFTGKVAFVTGAARGQGRSHAVRFAAEGADLILVDICAPIASVQYDLATPADLKETVAQIKALGHRAVARQADVRDREAIAEAVQQGVAELGRLDYVVANAGIIVWTHRDENNPAAFRDTIDVNLIGVSNTVDAALPLLCSQGTGGSIVITSSTAGIKSTGGVGPGYQAYTASKHAVVGLMRNLAASYAREGIRVNTVHPTGVATPMIENDVRETVLADDPHAPTALGNLLPVAVLDSGDVSNAVLWLCSDEARYITGAALPVDAGYTIQ